MPSEFDPLMDANIFQKTIKTKEMFKLIIAGGRDFSNYKLLKEKVDEMLSTKIGSFEIVIVSGMSEGADMYGEQYAAEMGYEVAEFSPYQTMGKPELYLRNIEMTIYADACICFWDGESKGTALMIDLAKEYGLGLQIVNY